MTRSPNPEVPFPRSRALFERARAVIPGGIHLSGRPLFDPEASPLYFDRGSGATIRDVDGNEYVDFFMAFGPHVLGYAHPEVDAAACAQLREGALLSMNHPLHVAFAERLIERFPAAEMAIPFKTGSDATTAALRIARQATGRRKVVRSGYHGWHDWCLPLEPFVPSGLDREVLELDANRPESLEAILSVHRGEVAAVIVAPEMIEVIDGPALGALIETTRAHGALFVLDEVKTAFRTHPGSVQQRLALAPDMTTLSKALGNGWPVAAVVGKAAVLRAGAGMHYSGTYHGETAAIAAAMCTLDILEREPVTEHLDALGVMLIRGFNERVEAHGVSGVAYAEPIPAMPFFRFTYDSEAARARATRVFYEHIIKRGFLLHPRHLWFVSYAHHAPHIERLLDAADDAFRHVRRALAAL